MPLRSSHANPSSRCLRPSPAAAGKPFRTRRQAPRHAAFQRRHPGGNDGNGRSRPPARFPRSLLPEAHRSAVVGCFRGTRARHRRREEDARLHRAAVPGCGPASRASATASCSRCRSSRSCRTRTQRCRWSGAGGQSLALRSPDDVVVWTKRPVPSSGIANTEVVYAGYGIVAPEYGWDDYAGLDVRGKLVLALVNDPGFATQDPQLFTGNAMTYYGRWDYKFAEAVRHGAAGLLVIHETKAAGYPWDVPRNGASNRSSTCSSTTTPASGSRSKAGSRKTRRHACCRRRGWTSPR